MIRVEIDRDRCTGHGRCYAVSPAVFAPDDEGYGVLITEDVPDEHAEQVRLATINCPEYAISVADPAD